MHRERNYINRNSLRNWWDFQKTSLIATIHAIRPDLIPFSENVEKIPSESPKGIPQGI